MKKIFCVALLLGTSFTGFAQMKTPQQAVGDAHKALVGSIQQGLVGEKKAKPDFGGAKKTGTQFLLRGDERTLSAFSIKPNSVGIAAVYNALKGLGEATAYLAPNPVRRPNEAIDKSTKDGVLTKAYYETRDEIYTRVQKGDAVSDVEYTVTLGWEVRITSDSVKKANDVRLVSVMAAKNQFTRNEIASMQNAAKKAITDWYAGLPEGLDAQYTEGAINRIEGIDVNAVNVERNGQTFTASDVHAIIIPVDPTPHFEEGVDPALYAGATASYELNPEFEVKIGNDFTTVTEFKVSDFHSELNEPVTTIEMQRRKTAARVVAQSFASKLPAYVANPTKEGKAELEGMFVGKKSVVQVSNVSRQGRERIDERTVDQYFSRLKATGITINLGTPVENSNLETIEYPIDQDYFSRTYNDNTDKTLVLKYIDGSYLIEKVVVKPGSTTLK